MNDFKSPCLGTLQKKIDLPCCLDRKTFDRPCITCCPLQGRIWRQNSLEQPTNKSLSNDKLESFGDNLSLLCLKPSVDIRSDVNKVKNHRKKKRNKSSLKPVHGGTSKISNVSSVHEISSNEILFGTILAELNQNISFTTSPQSEFVTRLYMNTDDVQIFPKKSKSNCEAAVENQSPLKEVNLTEQNTNRNLNILITRHNNGEIYAVKNVPICEATESNSKDSARCDFNSFSGIYFGTISSSEKGHGIPDDCTTKCRTLSNGQVLKHEGSIIAGQCLQDIGKPYRECISEHKLQEVNIMLQQTDTSQALLDSQTVNIKDKSHKYPSILSVIHTFLPSEKLTSDKRMAQCKIDPLKKFDFVSSRPKAGKENIHNLWKRTLKDSRDARFYTENNNRANILMDYLGRFHDSGLLPTPMIPNTVDNRAHEVKVDDNIHDIYSAYGHLPSGYHDSDTYKACRLPLREYYTNRDEIWRREKLSVSPNHGNVNNFKRYSRGQNLQNPNLEHIFKSPRQMYCDRTSFSGRKMIHNDARYLFKITEIGELGSFLSSHLYSSPINMDISQNIIPTPSEESYVLETHSNTWIQTKTLNTSNGYEGIGIAVPKMRVPCKSYLGRYSNFRNSSHKWVPVREKQSGKLKNQGDVDSCSNKQSRCLRNKEVADCSNKQYECLRNKGDMDDCNNKKSGHLKNKMDVDICIDKQSGCLRSKREVDGCSSDKQPACIKNKGDMDGCSSTQSVCLKNEGDVDGCCNKQTGCLKSKEDVDHCDNEQSVLLKCNGDMDDCNNEQSGPLKGIGDVDDCNNGQSECLKNKGDVDDCNNEQSACLKNKGDVDDCSNKQSVCLENKGDIDVRSNKQSECLENKRVVDDCNKHCGCLESKGKVNDCSTSAKTDSTSRMNKTERDEKSSIIVTEEGKYEQNGPKYWVETDQIQKEKTCGEDCFLSDFRKKNKFVLSHLAPQALHAAQSSQITCEAVHLATGKTIAEFEKILHHVSPTICPEFIHQTCLLCLGKRWLHDSICKHQIPVTPLTEVWRWYEHSGSYGLEIKAEDIQKFKKLEGNASFQAYFYPSLSAIQLFTYSHNSSDQSCRSFPYDCKDIQKSLQSEDEMGETSISDDTSSPFCSDNSAELVYEFFEVELPQNRKPLHEKMKDLARDVNNNYQAFGDPPKLERMPLNDLHPSSWYAVAWYPIYRIPEGNLRAAFLTYHSLGHLVRKSMPSTPPKEAIIFPALGLQYYNAQDECWFYPREPREEDAKEGESCNITDMFIERLRTLDDTAVVFSKGCVYKGTTSVVNRHQDFEFFMSRR